MFTYVYDLVFFPIVYPSFTNCRNPLLPTFHGSRMVTAYFQMANEFNQSMAMGQNFRYPFLLLDD